MFDLDTISKVIVLVSAIIGAGTAFYNVFLKGEHSRKQEYYKEVLKPFLVEYSKNPNISAVGFIRSRVDRNNDNIPKYIFCLADSTYLQGEETNSKPFSQVQQKEEAEKNEKLRKVLLYDYWKMYPNVYNRKLALFKTVRNMLSAVIFLMSYCFIFLGATKVARGVLLVVPGDTAVVILLAKMLLNILGGFGIAFVGVIPVWISDRLVYDDMYTTKKKRIDKLIEKKISEFEKIQEENVI